MGCISRFLSRADIKVRLTARVCGRHLSALCIAIAALIVAGCGMQLGQNVSSGTSCYNLKPSVGIISIERGQAFLSQTPEDRNLLCILALCPGARYKSSPSVSNGRLISARQFWFDSDVGRIVFSYSRNGSSTMWISRGTTLPVTKATPSSLLVA